MHALSGCNNLQIYQKRLLLFTFGKFWRRRLRLLQIEMNKSSRKCGVKLTATLQHLFPEPVLV